jgi:hypothetical protein
MTENGTYDVAAVEADGRINVDSGFVFELDTVTPGCDAKVAPCNDGTRSAEGHSFSSL